MTIDVGTGPGRGVAPLALAAALLALVPLGTHAELTFLAIGDTPYDDQERVHIEDEVRPAIAASGAPFLVHYGDLKGGGGPCPTSIAAMIEARDWVHALHPGPVFYTPGDNEWTDCDRGEAPAAFSETEALGRLRTVFFDVPPVPPAEQAAWGFARQSGFPENARWSRDGVQFVTVHLVGTNNGRVQILHDDVEVALRYVEARDRANEHWLEAAFRAARGAAALVIVTQADVTSPDGGASCTMLNRQRCDAFEVFRAQLAAYASGFRDRRGAPLKPILLLHGDTYPYCLDRGFGGDLAPNLWRLNAWGDYQRPADATRVTVRPDDTAEPFVVETLLGGQAPGAC